MSKSLGNYVGVTESPDEMFGKVMSISDELMWRYYLLLTDLSESDIAGLKARVAAGADHPKQAKQALARRIVTDFHDAAAASDAVDRFEKRARGEATGTEPVLDWTLPADPKPMRQLLVELKLAASGSDADRKLEQGAVTIDGERIGGRQASQNAHLRRGAEHRLTVGRRVYRLRVS
jgi:tyrosyl-tRNA synthetase